MLPATELDALNNVFRCATELDLLRGRLNPLHEQKLKATFSKFSANSPSRIVSEIIYACFLRDFEAADKIIDAEFERSWPASPVLANFQQSMLRCFRVKDFLRHVRNNIEDYIGDPEYLYAVYQMSFHHGLFQLSEKAADMLARLKLDVQKNAIDYCLVEASRRCGLTDDDVADFLDCGLKAVRAHFLNQVNLRYAISIELLEGESPEMLVFTALMGGSYEDQERVQDQSFSDLSEKEFSLPVCKHLALSIRDIGRSEKTSYAAREVS